MQGRRRVCVPFCMLRCVGSEVWVWIPVEVALGAAIALALGVVIAVVGADKDRVAAGFVDVLALVLAVASWGVFALVLVAGAGQVIQGCCR